MNALRVFYGKQTYEAYLEQERRERLAKLVAERKQALAMQRSVQSRAVRAVPMPTSAETCQRIADIVARKDVLRHETEVQRFARNVRLVSGGAPGLGQR